jgi:GTP-binding protein YchF
MSLKIGIVGLPNVGKSTLFNALMRRAQAQAANHPFTTIEPNVGIVDVPDLRLQELAKIASSEKIIPATVTFVDIAGIIRGASKGEGLGNQFLSHIREADAIALVLRCFADDSIIHVEGKVDPMDDARTVLLELILADLGTVQKKLDTLGGDVRAGNKDALIKKALYERLYAALENEQLASTVPFVDEKAEAPFLKELQLLTRKPVLYVANVSENDAAKSSDEIIAGWNLQELFKYAPGNLIPVSARVEAEVAELDEADGKEYMESLGLTEPGLNRLIRSGYDLLGLSTYLTAGPKEARAWTFKTGWTAPQCAGVIHGDFEKGFIRAEVVSYNDYIEYKGEQGAKAVGKLRSEGKGYVMQDGDVVEFRFNV